MSNEAEPTDSDSANSNPYADRRGFLSGILGGTAVGLTGAAESVGAADAQAVGNPRLFHFVGGKAGAWSVASMTTIRGAGLDPIERLDIGAGQLAALPEGTRWVLHGVTSNTRYTTRTEKETLLKKQVALGRPTATHAVVIPIRKSAKWWDLSQDERRAIFEEQSKHTTVGLKYLPAIARRLHHCRDLSTSEPFDFITLFDFAKEDATAFDDMLATMRASEEWKYIDREVDIRLVRA